MFSNVICKKHLWLERKKTKYEFKSFALKCKWYEYNEENIKCYKWAKNNTIFCKEHHFQYINDYCSTITKCGCLCLNKKYDGLDICFDCYYKRYNQIPYILKPSILDFDNYNYNLKFENKFNNKSNNISIILLFNIIPYDSILNILIYLSFQDILNLYNLNIKCINYTIDNYLLNDKLCNIIMNFPIELNYKLSKKIFLKETLRKLVKETQNEIVLQCLLFLKDKYVKEKKRIDNTFKIPNSIILDDEFISFKYLTL